MLPTMNAVLPSATAPKDVTLNGARPSASSAHERQRQPAEAPAPARPAAMNLRSSLRATFTRCSTDILIAPHNNSVLLRRIPVCPDYAVRQHDGLRRRAHRAVGAREGNDSRVPDGTPVTIFMRKPAYARGRHSAEGRQRLYGGAKIHKSGPVMKRSGTVSSRRRGRATPTRSMPSSLRSRKPRICSGQPLT